MIKYFELNKKMEKQVSQQDVDYASFIVYYKRKHDVCDHILQMCAPYTSEFILQDVDTLKKPYPEWLRGVPTVVQLPDYQVYRGTSAMHTVQTWCDSQLTSTAPTTSTQGGALTSNVQSARLDMASPNTMPLLQEDSRYTDGKTKKRSQESDLGQVSSLEELMRLRSKGAHNPSIVQ